MTKKPSPRRARRAIKRHQDETTPAVAAGTMLGDWPDKIDLDVPRKEIEAKLRMAPIALGAFMPDAPESFFQKIDIVGKRVLDAKRISVIIDGKVAITLRLL